jgi:hypothetical protein
MKHAKIISGAYENCWGDPNAEIVSQDGEVNWGAAFRADPGCKKCPECNGYFWNEAAVMECPDCAANFGDGVPPPKGE